MYAVTAQSLVTAYKMTDNGLYLSDRAWDSYELRSLSLFVDCLDRRKNLAQLYQYH
jgi:hypothetical protein